ncbi:hypothetical protein AB4Y85_13855 [Microvirga sp. 2YAF29]|uniref:hypothetical protein n=1 Tax=Microvirga sp. 2YAF29 TaxID=3233031 RepID=UPI003F9D5805
MILRIQAFAALAVTMFPVSYAAAGPCAPMIDRAQEQVDARIDAQAGSGAAAPESTGAMLHHEPTPGSIANAERKSGDGSRAQTALALLAQARKADAAGDAAGCERALEELRAMAR